MKIIGEIGINANGDINTAKQMIDMAVRAGADYVKFQKRTIDKCFSQSFLDSYRESPWGITQREQKEGLEFDYGQYVEIDRYCNKVGIGWSASAWDIEAQDFLAQFNRPFNKIAHQMVNNKDLLIKVANEKKMTYISIDNNLDLDLVSDIVDIYNERDCKFVLMHCVAKKHTTLPYWGKYIVSDEEVNLKRMDELRKHGKVGFSCHANSVLVPVLASLNAEAIEVHITLDRSFYGTDQDASFEEAGLRRIVRDVRRVEKLL